MEFARTGKIQKMRASWSRLTGVACCGSYHTACVTRNGGLFTWGCAEHGQVRVIAGAGFRSSQTLTPSSSRSVQLPRSHSVGAPSPPRAVHSALPCVLNEYRTTTRAPCLRRVQLGVGDTVSLEDGSFAPVRVEAHTLGSAPVVMVSAGKFHTAALTDDGRVWAWGQGKLGALGVSDCSEDQRTPRHVHSHQLSCECVVAVACGNAHVRPSLPAKAAATRARAKRAPTRAIGSRARHCVPTRTCVRACCAQSPATLPQSTADARAWRVATNCADCCSHRVRHAVHVGPE
jgi:hypothetical protein